MPRQRRASLFLNGGSQAVRLPKEFRFAAKEVSIRKEGNAVILEPVAKVGWPRGYWERLASLPPAPRDFAPPAPLSRSRKRETILRKLGER